MKYEPTLTRGTLWRTRLTRRVSLLAGSDKGGPPGQTVTDYLM
jgi:hypothetical protein